MATPSSMSPGRTATYGEAARDPDRAPAVRFRGRRGSIERDLGRVSPAPAAFGAAGERQAGHRPNDLLALVVVEPKQLGQRPDERIHAVGALTAFVWHPAGLLSLKIGEKAHVMDQVAVVEHRAWLRANRLPATGRHDFHRDMWVAGAANRVGHHVPARVPPGA